MLSRVRRRRLGAFTLVELLVVIAIIGILIALLLPAVQSAREAARRLQCTNQVKQMMLGMHNHENTFGVFPTGGIEPWPNIEDYSANGKPFTVDKQGLSWAFQILPYLEEGAVFNLGTTDQIRNSPVSAYFCPSRRPPTQHPSGRWLMDYGALVPIAGASDYPSPLAAKNLYTTGSDGFVNSCNDSNLWRTPSPNGGYKPQPLPSASKQDVRYQYYGVVVRSRYYRDLNEGEEWTTNYTPPVSFAKISDGSSHTSVVTEKWIDIDTYGDGSTPSDDAGWSDGWDFDAMRLACCKPRPDSANGDNLQKFTLATGSAHTAGVNTGFADGSVQFIRFDVEPEVFNLLANRKDGETLDTEAY